MPEKKSLICCHRLGGALGSVDWEESLGNFLASDCAVEVLKTGEICLPTTTNLCQLVPGGVQVISVEIGSLV